MTDTWRYALVGTVVALGLTINRYWESGMGSEFSLEMVFVGGLVAGYLAARASTEAKCGAVGFRTGVVGSLPGLWLVGGLFQAALGWSSPLWFRVVTVFVLLVCVSVFLFVLGGLFGALGAKIGGWVAAKTARRTSPVGG